MKPILRRSHVCQGGSGNGLLTQGSVAQVCKGKGSGTYNRLHAQLSHLPEKDVVASQVQALELSGVGRESSDARNY